ncbi:hypothetical protein FRB97_008899 [Tulasnella sp. 331]|nr:hypothetical protein FRB97_008899 [Tulasnella sp. 331]
MSRTNTGTGGAYGALNDYCRANRIKLDWTAVSDGPQNNVTWTATVMLRNDEAQRYIGQGGSKKAALAAASENPLDVEDVVAWSDGSAG